MSTTTDVDHSKPTGMGLVWDNVTTAMKEKSVSVEELFESLPSNMLNVGFDKHLDLSVDAIMKFPDTSADFSDLTMYSYE